MKLGRNRALCDCLILLACGLGVTLGQNPSSPCPDVFRYERGEQRWYGLITGRSSSYGDEIKTVIYMEYDGSPRDADIGKLTRLTPNEAIPDLVARGGAIRYRVGLNIRPLPRVYKIEFNGRVVCQGPEGSDYGVTTARREHTLYANGHPSGSASTPRPPPHTEGVRPTTAWVCPTTEWARPTSEYRPPAPVAPAVPQRCGVCRADLYNHIGEKQPGEWPWLVALHHNSLDGLYFRCGASLLGDRYVITAAHCLYNPNTQQQVERKNVVIIVGASNLSHKTFQDDETRTLSAMYVHEEYNTETSINDIALLVLDKPVTYTKLVKPVCPWDGRHDQELLVTSGQLGTVVGWGATGDGQQVPLPLEVQVVSLTECRGSHPYSHALTTDRSLCAGNKDNRGSCNGDSGSGLYIKQDNRWRLRGLVSTSLKGTSLGTMCNLTPLVIYTDVAKYRAWIKEAVFESLSF